MRERSKTSTTNLKLDAQLQKKKNIGSNDLALSIIYCIYTVGDVNNLIYTVADIKSNVLWFLC